MAQDKSSAKPRVFLSYSHDDEAHLSWVRNLAETLELGAVHVTFDQWNLQLGMDLTHFMEDGRLDWERLDAKRACRIRHVLDLGGLSSGEDRWPTIQQGMIDAMARLAKALKPQLPGAGSNMALQPAALLDSERRG